MSGAVLVTGGTGKLGRRTVEHLAAAGHAVRAGSRAPAGPGQIRFDWADPSTFGAFEGVGAVLVVAPPGAADPLAAMRPGLERALAAGARRFVLAGASSIPRGGPMTGAVYDWLADRAPEWIVLRPSWFMQNFSEGQHLPTIRDERAVYSATGDGRVAFIDADDIARTAAVALTAPGHPNGELLLTGPRALSYADVAAILSEAIGARVEHRRLTEAAMAARFTGFGLPAPFAAGLAAMDAAIAAGAEDRVTDAVRAETGTEPAPFEAFARANAAVWRPGSAR